MRLIDGKASYWRRGLGWLVRLFLILFVVFAASFWTDILFKTEEYDRLFGSEHACAVSKAYCSWNSYILAQIPPSLLAIAAVVALLWRRLPRREPILNALAIIVCVFLAWSVIQVHLNVYAE